MQPWDLALQSSTPFANMSSIPKATPGWLLSEGDGKIIGGWVLGPLPSLCSFTLTKPHHIFYKLSFDLHSFPIPPPQLDTVGLLSPSSMDKLMGRTSATGAAWCTNAMLASGSSACLCASASRIITGRARPLSVCVSMLATLPSHGLKFNMDFLPCSLA